MVCFLWWHAQLITCNQTFQKYSGKTVKEQIQNEGKKGERMLQERSGFPQFSQVLLNLAATPFLLPGCLGSAALLAMPFFPSPFWHKVLGGPVHSPLPAGCSVPGESYYGSPPSCNSTACIRVWSSLPCSHEVSYSVILLPPDFIVP